MDILTVEGGHPLKGEIVVSGSKNAALPILIATLLTDEPCQIQNVPYLDDIDTVVKLLAFIGKEVIREGNTVSIKSGMALRAEAPYDLVRRMRASVVVMGPLLARLGHVKVSLPGGCAIGGRPINIHLDGFRRLGAEIDLDQGYVEMRADRLRGNTIAFEFASVGATENVMMAAALSEGTSVLSNAAREPEIVDLADFLNAMGAQIKGAGTDTITIQGVLKLHGANHKVIPDRIEAGTYLLAGAMAQGELLVREMNPEHLTSLISHMKLAGIPLDIKPDSVRVKAPKKLLPVNVETAVHPGFPTDLQAQWMALMLRADGVSEVTENVFENRFMHVAELSRMGADIETKGGKTAVIKGVSQLSGADVMVSDLRAGAALVLAGLVAQGKTTIHRVYHLDRGYESIEEKLRSIGAKITRSKE